MAIISSRDEGVPKILKLLGLSIHNLREVHIHIMPDDIVRADCVYFVDVNDCEELITEIKKYYLQEIKDDDSQGTKE